MTADPRFTARVKRLVAVSAVALGLISLLVAMVTTDSGWYRTALAAAGWVLMPTLLGYSIRHPRWRYLLSVPTAAVSAALVLVATDAADSGWATAGWWLMTGGVLTGGLLGAWFWYRWLPVPRRFDDPFSPGRWALVAAHTGVIVAGWLLVFLAEVL
jgi:hypothetical protein